MRDRDDLRADMMISQAGDEILKQAGKSFPDAGYTSSLLGMGSAGPLGA